MLGILIGAVLLAIPAALGPTALRVREPVPWVLAAIVCAAASIILVVEATSILDAFNRGGTLLAQALIAAAVAAAWSRAGRPRPPDTLRELPQRLRATLRAQPAVAPIIVAAGAALAFQLVVALAVNPNNGDSMMYHLSRAAHWVQNESATQFVGGTVWQLGYPPAGEMLMAWTMVLSGADRLAPLVQWIAACGTGATIFLGARLLGFAKPASAFAAALFVTMPIPILEATTTQVDLLAVLWIGCLAVFGVRGVRSGDRGELVVAALAAGLAIGTKGSALIAGLPLALLLAAAAWQARPSRALVLFGTGAAVTAIAALGAFNYVLNVRNTSNLNGHAADHLERTDPVVDNALRYAFSLVDLPGVSVGWLETAVKRVGKAIDGDLENAVFAYGVNTKPDETFSAFGPVAFLLLLPLALLAVFSPRGPPDRRALALCGLAAILLFVYVIGFIPAMPRNLIGIALLAPLLAVLAQRPWATAMATGLALLVLIPCLLVNPYKRVLPAEGEKPFWRLDRTEQQAIARPELAEMLRTVNRRLGADAPLGVLGPPGSWDYPFFGPDFKRRVERINDVSEIPARMREQRLAGVVILEAAAPPPGLRTEKVGAEPAIFDGPPRDYFLVLPSQ